MTPIPSALAAYHPPPEETAPSTKTTTTGTRGGCSQETNLPLTAIAPQNHVAWSSSRTPTLSWFVPDESPYPMEFQLYEWVNQRDQKLVYKTNLHSTQGLMHLSLANHPISLTNGGHYRWKIVLLCNPKYPSQSQVAEAGLKVIASPSHLATKIEVLHDSDKRAEIYAQNHYWYDAFSHSVTMSNHGTPTQLQTELLMDLAQTEDGAESTFTKSLSQILAWLSSVN